jgi:single-strand DNA-binding protein
MKSITIAGNIGKDAVTRTTQGGDKVTRWTVAVEERGGQDKRTIWFDCTLWGKRGETLAQYLTKGAKVAVSGELSTREHEGKTYLTVRAEQVTLMGGGQDRREDARDERAPAGGRGSMRDDLEDGIPFSMEWR